MLGSVVSHADELETMATCFRNAYERDDVGARSERRVIAQRSMFLFPPTERDPLLVGASQFHGRLRAGASGLSCTRQRTAVRAAVARLCSVALRRAASGRLRAGASRLSCTRQRTAVRAAVARLCSVALRRAASGCERAVVHIAMYSCVGCESSLGGDGSVGYEVWRYLRVCAADMIVSSCTVFCCDWMRTTVAVEGSASVLLHSAAM